MNQPFSKKSVRAAAMLLVAACLLAAGAFVFLQNDKQGAPVAQDSGAPAAKIKGKAVPNPIDLHEGEDQPAPHVEVSPDSNSIQANALKAEPAVSEAAKDTLGKSSLYWEKLGHYAGINRLIEAGRWDEILRMVRDGEFGVNQPVIPSCNLLSNMIWSFQKGGDHGKSDKSQRASYGPGNSRSDKGNGGVPPGFKMACCIECPGGSEARQ
ncbi:hypothetical protein [Desulfatibacillum alkenivorans]|jgi:hypothetical protein|uniref:hypothetical protein n=1 Tax=Desulfatibacillum alkenivorans TaxID=259354 RepID=UPI00147A4267|nr:hypothetical protein [Desulfatibacillum alkenivorans]